MQPMQPLHSVHVDPEGKMAKYLVLSRFPFLFKTKFYSLRFLGPFIYISRRSKIKCVHEGKSPCRNCLKSGRTDPGNCVLAAPKLSSSRPREKEVAVGEAPLCDPAKEVSTPHGRLLLRNVVGAFPKSLVVRSASHFKQKFPELAFLHIADFDANAQDRKGHLFIAALVTLCASSMNAAQELLVAVEDLAQMVRDGLSRAFWEPPDLTTVQALLIFSMYEWGSGRGYSAWMNTGKFHGHH